MRILALVAFALFTTASTAGAEGCDGAYDAVSVVQHIFDSADQDKDGSLTQAEYEGAGLQNYGVTFEESDTNADGATSIDEYLELYQRHHPPAGGTEA